MNDELLQNQDSVLLDFNNVWAPRYNKSKYERKGHAGIWYSMEEISL